MHYPKPLMWENIVICKPSCCSVRNVICIRGSECIKEIRDVGLHFTYVFALVSIPFAMDPALLRLEAIVLCLILTLVLLHRWLSACRSPLPPGPKGYPILGNTLPKALCVIQLSICIDSLNPLLSVLTVISKSGHRNMVPSSR